MFHKTAVQSVKIIEADDNAAFTCRIGFTNLIKLCSMILLKSFYERVHYECFGYSGRI